MAGVRLVRRFQGSLKTENAVKSDRDYLVWSNFSAKFHLQQSCHVFLVLMLPDFFTFSRSIFWFVPGQNVGIPHFKNNFFKYLFFSKHIEILQTFNFAPKYEIFVALRKTFQGHSPWLSRFPLKTWNLLGFSRFSRFVAILYSFERSQFLI